MTSRSTAAASPWFVRPPFRDPAARLFCFPHSGTGASAFSAWPAALDDVEVRPLQFPARENRLCDPHYGTYERLAADVVEALVPLLDRPFAFFGHCTGALAAYESALRLAERGLPAPGLLVVSGQPPPHEASHDRMLTLTVPELRLEVEAFVRGRGVEPRPDLIDMGLDVLLRDHAAARRYARSEPAVLGCPVVVLHWRDDPEVSLDDLRGWRRYAPSVAFEVLDGGHHAFTRAPEAMRRVLTRWR